MRMTLANTIKKKNLCISHSDTDQQQHHFSLISAFCLPRKGLKLEKLTSISTLEHSIKEQVSKAHIKNSRLEANVKLMKLITVLSS